VQPQAVFIPYQKEPPRDHWVTYTIVMDALKTQDQHMTVYEYPIWHWHSWPWTKRPAQGSERRKHARTSRVAIKNILTHEFNASVDIRAVRDVKQAALNEHRSQTIKLVDDPDWKRLIDVADGDFLACFFQDREVFRQRSV
jgi:LmbE family N-acetylglucosaminyl deacetylase